ncbi:MAG: bile acid:sodium symporter [Mariniblastus sp.]|nr:bile acid:sodium symporter [Mariniblastus sp.]
MKSIASHWFLLVLLAALAIGFATAQSCRFVVEASWLKWGAVTVTMFVMAWPLEFKHIWGAATRPIGPVLATLLNLLVIPLMAWPFSHLLGEVLGPGLIVAAAVPTTLATGAVWTRRAGGDDSLAIMVTIITNLLCFFVTPAWVYYLTGGTSDKTAFIGTIYKLLCFVVFPMLVGQLVRFHASSADWATRKKRWLSLAAQFGVLFMIFLGAVSTGIRVSESGGLDITVMEVALMLVVILGIHLSVCFSGVWLAKRVGLPRSAQIAVGFSGSQKTLMVGLSTAISMGISIIPLVAYHSLQLITDTVIADRFRNKDK